jgi:hypothetical protein
VIKEPFTYRRIDPRDAYGRPITKVTSPPIMQPQRAVNGSLVAMHLAWKSKAAKLPIPRIKMVHQFQNTAFGLNGKEKDEMMMLNGPRDGHDCLQWTKSQ